MIQINFYADSDLEDFSKDIKEYEEIWKSDGENIVCTWEKLSGLKFKETFINAIVSGDRSMSHPLNLRCSYLINQKKSAFVHELGHRILYKRINGMKSISSLGHHKLLDLLLPDVLLEIYGNDLMLEAIDFESINLSHDYKTAWEWALSFSKEERLGLFKEILAGDLSKIQ